MSNNLNTIKSNAGLIAKAAAKELVDNLQFAKSISTADPADYKGKNGYSAGDTIYISKPARFIPVTNTFDITSGIQDVVEEKVPLALDIIGSVGIALDSQELASTIDLSSVYNRAVKPAVQSIAQSVEQTMLTRAKNATYNLVGTAGSTVFDMDTMLAAKEKMGKFLAPVPDRFALLDSTAMRSGTNAKKGLFQSSSEISKQYKDGIIGRGEGFDYLENNLLPTHTRGTATGAITVTTTSTEADATIALTGTGSQTLKAGDVFTVASRFAVHPITKTKLNFLQQFVVTADNTASGGSYTGVKISPSIYASSAGLQNVDSLPTSGDVVTLVGALSTGYTQCLAFHTDAFRMVSVPLILPEAVELAVQETYKGITVAIVRAFDVLKRRMITRVDFLGGMAATRSEWACRITS